MNTTMSVCVRSGITGEHLATLALEQSSTVRQAQKLLKCLLHIPKKEQRVMCNGDVLKPTQQLPLVAHITLVRVTSKCSSCGQASAVLRSCSGCFDAHYCGQDCQRKHRAPNISR